VREVREGEGNNCVESIVRYTIDIDFADPSGKKSHLAPITTHIDTKAGMYMYILLDFCL
jgi:hypothetical protein